MTILVDSSSSHTFISQTLAKQLEGVQPLSASIRVQVANGAVLQCASHIPASTWFVQEYNFISDIKLIPLDHYDMILGMDWLERFSPMKVPWKLKWMSIPYQGSTVVLHGISCSDPDTLMVQACPLASQPETSKIQDLLSWMEDKRLMSAVLHQHLH